MSDVRILPEIVSNRIAAGEVVERPVSIVKELVENSLDAGSTRITIEVNRGGRDLVRVSDNGDGMTRDNALLAIERYATSKIYSNDDLFCIKSFGFRGEALPSIASVSKFTLVTRAKGSDSGTRIFINGGKIMDVSDVGAPFGTEIEVKSLFFNTPVRRKFLKSINTEMGHIGDAFSGMALGNPGVGFRLFHNSRLVKSFLPSDDLLKRAGDVFGNETVKNFCHVSFESRDVMVTGYVSNPSLTRSTSRTIRLFVNNRMISDNGLVSAIFRGFQGRIMKGRFPMAVLFISLPFDQVDVNVHPAKLNVRFADQNHLYSIVADAVNEALCSFEKKTFAGSFRPGKQEKIRIAEASFTWQSPETKAGKPDISVERSSLRIDEKTNEKIDEKIDKKTDEKIDEKTDEKIDEKIDEEIDKGIDKKIGKSLKSLKEPDVFEFDLKKTARTSGTEKIIKKVPDSGPDYSSSSFNSPSSFNSSLSFNVIGQIFGTYILTESDNEIFLFDQHAAHERIVYEKLKKRSESFKPPSQSLIVPETLELGFREADLLEKIMDDLSLLGIIVEPFGGTSFIVKSVPAIIDDRQISPFIREMLDKILESGTDTGDDMHKRKWLDDVMILMACHSAIRANYSLNLREMEKLIHDLEKCDNPFHCPHGRPTRIQWSKKEIEKLFKRTV